METIGTIIHKLFVQPGVARRREASLTKIRERGTARVCIIVSSLSMWRLEQVWRLMQLDSRFDCRIILIPFAKQSPEEKIGEMEKLRSYFRSREIPFQEEDSFVEFDPDIVFYQQFYSHSYLDPVRARHNEFRLLCYSPYGMMFIDKKWQYNSRFHNVAWKIFLQSESHKSKAYHLADNHGVNTVVTGDADSDAFLTPEFTDVWKPQATPKKRVIWAPHHRKLGRDSFGWTAEQMKDYAIRYKDSIQFAFKPHPRLKTELYKEWGQEKTDAYYEFWRDSENTQLETGSFIELFRGSDAMVHDSNSFIAEYLYTRKPALFLSTNTETIRSKFGQFGKDALDAHYLGDSASAITEFLDEVVLGGRDSMQAVRNRFHDTYLRTRDGRGFGEGVVDEIRKSIWG